MIEEADRAAAAIPDIVRAENDERDRIAARAYELYLERGGVTGATRTTGWKQNAKSGGDRIGRTTNKPGASRSGVRRGLPVACTTGQAVRSVSSAAIRSRDNGAAAMSDVTS